MQKIRLKSLLLTLSVFVFFIKTKGQNELNIKFGKISPADFQISAPQFDSGANVVVIANIAKVSFVGNERFSFDIVYNYFTRIKILNKNGFHAADIVSLLYNNREGIREKISYLKASTFNLQNGVIQETKLDEKSVFTQKRSKYYDEVKFSMPALNAGSIFDIEISIRSPYTRHIRSWAFQKNYPCLWSEYQATIPVSYNYYRTLKGNAKFDIETAKIVDQHLTISEDNGTQTNESASIYTSCNSLRWVMKNIPAIKNQPYLSTPDNYIPRISFDLNYFQQDKDHDKQSELGTWGSMSKKMLENKDFGADIDEENSWMNETLKNVLQNATDQESQIKAIFNFIRNNFQCNKQRDIYIENSLKEVFNKRVGNVAELNLLLVSMLRHQNIKANPAILSTRDNGIVAVNFPFIYQYNYVICVIQNNDKTYLLDASQSNNPFGSLPSYCFNWNTRVINSTSSPAVELIPDSLTENKTTSAFFSEDENGVYNGSVTTTYGNDESFDIREKIKSISQKDLLKDLQIADDLFSVSGSTYDSLTQPDYPLVFHYNLEAKDIHSKDIIYFNPIIDSRIKTNPLADAERIFPVEMTSKLDETYSLSMTIPKGFRIDELPKSARVSYNEGDGMFEYLIQQSGNNIQMRVHLKFNKATFSSDEYTSLRDFYAYVVKKESEQIVFKKL